MIASAPCRSRSRCQISSASPTIRAASSASTSSQEPGNCSTPNLADNLDLVVLDERIGQELLAQRLELPLLGDVQLDEAPDVYVLDALEAERRERPLDRDALRVEDARLGADQHARSHPAPVSASQSENDRPVMRS